jgi:hypothetical protein
VELLALMPRLRLVCGASISELIAVNMLRAELPSADSLGHAMAGPLEVTQKENTSAQLGRRRRKPQAMVQTWALFASH